MIELATVFSDGAVLQRNMFVPVWGRASGNQVIRGEVAGVSVQAISSAAGNFILYFPPLPMGMNYTLVVTEKESGNQVVVNDVAVGEVWLAGGQSNMEYPLCGNFDAPYCDKPLTDLVKKPLPQQLEYQRRIVKPEMIRMLTVKRCSSGAHESTLAGKWLPATKENSPRFSAVALHFATRLRDELQVPIGILSSSYGGTEVAAWTSRQGLRSNPATAHFVTECQRALASDENWEKYYFAQSLSPEEVFGEYCTTDRENAGLKNGWADLVYPDGEWRKMRVPGSWISQHIAGNGAVWFRQHVKLPEHWAGKHLTLHLGGIDKHDISYFNGVEVGRTGSNLDIDCYDQLRSYAIAPELSRVDDNVVAVRAFSFIYDGSLGGTSDDYFISCAENGEIVHLTGEWVAQAEYDLGEVALPYAMKKIGPGNQHTPSILFDGMIAPLIPYGIKGVIWYQGESNADLMRDALNYQAQLTTMIKDWRYNWGEGDFPFLMVQLAGFHQFEEYDDGSKWAVLREAQRQTCATVTNCDMAVILDAGDELDIHPTDKLTVGNRLAKIALKRYYGVVQKNFAGPLFRGMSNDGNGRIRLFFDNGDDLKFSCGETLRGMVIAGADNEFKTAHGVIESSTLLIWSDEVAVPVAVRYAWADNPLANLTNGSGIPASPFDCRMFS